MKFIARYSLIYPPPYNKKINNYLMLSSLTMVKVKKVKLSLYQAMEAHRVMRR
jgi:hypothetical protein